MHLVPAYGRDYKNQTAVLADFNAGKDFKIADISSPYDGAYVNKEQIVKNGIKRVTIRYKQLRSVMSVDVKAE